MQWFLERSPVGAAEEDQCFLKAIHTGSSFFSGDSTTCNLSPTSKCPQFHELWGTVRIRELFATEENILIVIMVRTVTAKIYY